jgi:hypothetical protein
MKYRLVDSLPEPQKSRELARLVAARRPGTIKSQTAHVKRDKLLICGCPPTSLRKHTVSFRDSDGVLTVETVDVCGTCSGIVDEPKLVSGLPSPSVVQDVFDACEKKT